jgi:hypothetical protein
LGNNLQLQIPERFGNLGRIKPKSVDQIPMKERLSPEEQI